MLTYMLLELVSAVVGAIAVIFILYQLQKRTHFMRFFKHKAVLIPLCLFVIAFFAGLIANRTYPPTFAMPAFMHSHAPGGVPASIPFNKILDFFLYENKFERVADIGADPLKVQPGRDEAVFESFEAEAASACRPHGLAAEDPVQHVLHSLHPQSPH
jgi:glucan phosphoethanolaminetransferase (alkaline phosphatase superfamily)